MALEKNYDPKAIEAHWYQIWEEKKYFSPQETTDKAPYCIMIPPPNVTGSLHMGHAFQQTLMDILIRYHRMQGNKTLWQVGTDHAGIATQMVVERQLAANNISRHDLGRDAFIEKIWEWKSESGNNITRQLRRIGASVDWSTERFTLDEGMSDAVIEVFIKLYDEGLIYRKKRLVNWDPVLKTAVSDLEVESIEEKGFLWYIHYPLTDGSGFITVATTRPETMLGDVAVAVHPDDARYQSLIGKKLNLPLTDRLIPIISDTSIDPNFGTGCVKITPAHDFNDNKMAEMHQLPAINILTLDAALNENTPYAYQGLDRFVARKKIIEDLKNLNLLEKIVDHTLSVPRGDRSGAILEPLLTDQWFVKIESLAKPAIQAVQSQQIRFIPENWSKTYFEWMNNIQDWCISRQLWWGHRIPAWFDNEGNIYVAKTEKAVREKYKLASDFPLKQDEDVLDTWFSSALWPFSTLGWPEKTERLQTFYPTNVLVTGFDIIFFWVARMIMFGLKFTGEIPFKEIYIHGLIQGQDGQKMSKTKGNVLDPLDLIDGIGLEDLVKKRTTGLMQPQLAEQIAKKTRAEFPNGIPSFGTDALRFTYAALATTGRHIRFDLARVEGYRHFCNKLWNAARFVILNLEDFEPLDKDFKKPIDTIDQWIFSRWQKTKLAVNKHLVEYRFDLASQALYDFTWNEFCDWYLEFFKPKPVLTIRSARHYTLVTIFEELLRALHPFIPYITEEIWQKIAPLANIQGETIMTQSFPQPENNHLNEKAETDIEWLKATIIAVRNIRGELNLSPAKLIPLVLWQDLDKISQKETENRINTFGYCIKSLAKIETLSLLDPNTSKSASATGINGNLELFIPLEGLIDKSAEIARLQKEIDKAQKDFDKINQKLSNERFVQNAPKEIVLQEKNRLAEITALIEKLKKRLMDHSTIH